MTLNQITQTVYTYINENMIGRPEFDNIELDNVRYIDMDDDNIIINFSDLVALIFLIIG